MDVTLGTIRINFIVRRRKIVASIIGFVEVTIFVAVIARVIQDIENNIYGIFAYGAGFAIGTLIGITISDKLSQDLISTNIISKSKSDEIVNFLRREGFGATCYNGVGKDGNVQIINVICRYSHLSGLNEQIYKIDPDIFVTSHTLGSKRGGYIYGMKKK